MTARAKRSPAKAPSRELEDAVAMLEAGVFGLTACGSHMTDDGHDIGPYVRTVELALIELRRHVVPYGEALP
jgi:hypothetical protein